MKHKRSAAFSIGALLLAAISAAAATTGSHQTPSPAAARDLQSAWQAFSDKDAASVKNFAAKIPKNHPLQPWAMGWAMIADPHSDPATLSALAKKMPASAMKERLLEEAALRFHKKGLEVEARALFSIANPKMLGAASRCAKMDLEGGEPSMEAAIEAFSALPSAEPCKKIASTRLSASLDAMAASTIKTGAKALPDGILGASEAKAAAEALLARPRFDPAWPLASKEALSRAAASALGSGKCRSSELAPPEHLTARGKANSARCALWNGDLRGARKYWEALGSENNAEPRWAALLWATAPRRSDGASIGLPESSYFNALAHLSNPATWIDAKAPGAAEASCKSDPGAYLAIELWLHGLRREASDAFKEPIERLGDASRECLGQMALEAGAFPLRIAALTTKDGRFNPKAYEPGFGAQIEAAAKRHGIEPGLLASLARQESRFDEMAYSRVGAAGLGQLMPATAKEVAKELGWPAPQPQQLFDPAYNLELSAKYFSKLIAAQPKGALHWALCSYNAGGGRCGGWRSKLASLPPFLQIEAMPFDETRAYVERILASYALQGRPDLTRIAFIDPAAAKGGKKK